MLGMTTLYYNLAPSFLWPASRSYTFHIITHAFLHNHSRHFLKHAHTALPYVIAVHNLEYDTHGRNMDVVKIQAKEGTGRD